MNKLIATTALILAGALTFAACSPKSETPVAAPASTAPATESGAAPSAAAPADLTAPSGAKPASQGGGDKL